MVGKGYSEDFRNMDQLCIHRLQGNRGTMSTPLHYSSTRNTIERRERLKLLLEQALEICQEEYCYESEKDVTNPDNSDIDGQRRFVDDSSSSSAKRRDKEQQQ